MNFDKIIPVLKAVLLNPFVIGAAVVIILYCNFVCYVVRYKKKPPQPKKKRIVEAAPQPAPQAEQSADGEGGEKTDSDAE